VAPAVTASPVARRALVRLVLSLLAVVAAACDSGSGPRPAAPTTAPNTVPPVTEAPTTTAAPVTTTTVPGPPRTSTTIPVDITPGQARISGTVVGPQGPVAGATVRVERLVGSEVAGVDVSTDGGSFTLASVRGGRYRVRAWKKPDLVQPEPEAFFLAADEQKSLELRVTKVSDFNVQTTVEPDPPPSGDPFAITVFLYAGSVSDDGVLQASPRAGQEVQIVLGPGLGLASTDRAKTDGSGKASFAARCRTPGPQTGDLVVSAAVRTPLALPNCR
jgi:hypothetical protein